MKHTTGRILILYIHQILSIPKLVGWKGRLASFCFVKLDSFFIFNLFTYKGLLKGRKTNQKGNSLERESFKEFLFQHCMYYSQKIRCKVALVQSKMFKISVNINSSLIHTIFPALSYTKCVPFGLPVGFRLFLATNFRTDRQLTIL
jgi:hypothetical protein